MTEVVVLDVSFVKKCVDYLRARRIHRQFVGYLCICEAAAVAGRQDKLQPAFRTFFDRFLTVASPPPGTPYLIPFNDTGSMESNVWLNSNIAGSYAPSSIRSQAPLRRVVDIFGAARQSTFALRDGHEDLCLENLLYGEPVDPIALAGFLFRDHGFTLHEKKVLTTSDLVAGLYALINFTSENSRRMAIFYDSTSSVEAEFSYDILASNI